MTYAVVSGGGTSGHVLPAIAVAEALVRRGHDPAEIHYMGARRGIETRAQGLKSIYYLAGLAEGAETIAAFALMCLVPSAFGWIAGLFAALCFVSAAARILAAGRILGSTP